MKKIQAYTHRPEIGDKFRELIETDELHSVSEDVGGLLLLLRRGVTWRDLDSEGDREVWQVDGCMSPIVIDQS